MVLTRLEPHDLYHMRINDLRNIATITIAHHAESDTYFLRNGSTITELDKRTAQSLIATQLIQSEQLLENAQRTLRFAEMKHNALFLHVNPAGNPTGTNNVKPLKLSGKFQHCVDPLDDKE